MVDSTKTGNVVRVPNGLIPPTRYPVSFCAVSIEQGATRLTPTTQEQALPQKLTQPILIITLNLVLPALMQGKVSVPAMMMTVMVGIKIMMVYGISAHEALKKLVQ